MAEKIGRGKAKHLLLFQLTAKCTWSFWDNLSHGSTVRVANRATVFPSSSHTSSPNFEAKVWISLNGTPTTGVW